MEGGINTDYKSRIWSHLQLINRQIVFCIAENESPHLLNSLAVASCLYILLLQCKMMIKGVI